MAFGSFKHGGVASGSCRQLGSDADDSDQKALTASSGCQRSCELACKQTLSSLRACKSEREHAHGTDALMHMLHLSVATNILSHLNILSYLNRFVNVPSVRQSTITALQSRS